MANDGYSVNMRQDVRTGEYLAVVPSSYEDRHGERYYMAIGESDGTWRELSPGYLTRTTRTTDTFPGWLKRYFDRRMGYIMNLAPRLYG